jgi:hypothetical protein
MSSLSPCSRGVRAALAVALAAGVAVSAGCTLDPRGPAPIYSRLPAAQSGLPDGQRPLTEAERKQYAAIDKQVMADQNQAFAADAAAQAWSRYYTPPPAPYYGYGYGGWTPGWTVGYGYYPGW